MSPRPSLNLVLGDMLFDGLPGLPPNAPVWMKEDWTLCTRVRHHRHKLVLFLSAMRHFAARLESDGRPVHYRRLVAGEAEDLLASLRQDLGARPPGDLHTYEPADAFLLPRLRSTVEEAGWRLVLHPNPMFLTPAEDWRAYREGRKRLLMHDFYVRQRQRMRLLVTPDGEPIGGKWSFDADNRKRLPKGHRPPGILPPPPDPLTREVMAMVDRTFPEHAGSASTFATPVTHAAAREALESFVEERLDLFGDYEDALSTEHRTLYHGVLTPMLNCGLLTPEQIVFAALDRHERRPVPLNGLEGFIRQVVGWREFIRGVDREFGEEIPNALGHARRLGPGWWDGTTGLPPLDLSIRRAVETGWCHHIERLMVLGSAMLMAEVHPGEAYRWFMEMFIDSADWVMRPNVLEMSQFAAGGLFATKPYLSGSNYLLKMGDYRKGPWCDVWDGLYWRFVRRHPDLFRANPRMGFIVESAFSLEPARWERISLAAETWIASATLP